MYKFYGKINCEQVTCSLYRSSCQLMLFGGSAIRPFTVYLVFVCGLFGAKESIDRS